MKNDDQHCLKWALLSARRPADKNADRVTKYIAYEDELNFTGMFLYTVSTCFFPSMCIVGGINY